MWPYGILNDDPAESCKTRNVVMEYAFYGTENELSNLRSIIGRAVYKMSRPVIDSSNKKKDDSARGGRRSGGMKILNFQ